jgi:hypothetical protein
MLRQAFSSRPAVGVLGANVALRRDCVVSGGIAGRLISVPVAFGFGPLLCFLNA